MKKLFWIRAPYFTASVIVHQNSNGILTVVAAAPILKWTIGKAFNKVLEYWKSKGFTVLEVHNKEDEK